MPNMRVLLSAALLIIFFSFAAANVDLCQTCQDLVKEAENAMDYSDTWLKEHIDDICGKLEVIGAKDYCLRTLKKLIEKLDELIKNKCDPKKACEQINLCS
ncbi:hypothetical protein QR680_018581 [Steinernema hermaphroditum]|uniref:Saposin B-type domain-containing protein n=1 Tax=Steinernema hermaphroditum TaxID=289476 RepID=A0AA39HKR1_9BILA|nr:hypothetical protein QR680_018581 [Steinernema hermaphroditum]